MPFPSLNQNDLNQIDNEIEDIARHIGRLDKTLGIEGYETWMILKGGWSLNPRIGKPYIKLVYQGDKLLADVLTHNFQVWQRWTKNGKKLTNIGNFGIDESTNETEKSNDKTFVSVGNENTGFSEEDVPF